MDDFWRCHFFVHFIRRKYENWMELLASSTNVDHSLMQEVVCWAHWLEGQSLEKVLILYHWLIGFRMFLFQRIQELKYFSVLPKVLNSQVFLLKELLKLSDLQHVLLCELDISIEECSYSIVEYIFVFLFYWYRWESRGNTHPPLNQAVILIEYHFA